MNAVHDNTFGAKHKAITWLDGLSRPKFEAVQTDYPNGPLFECENAETAVDFLLRCAALEERVHTQDADMEGVELTIAFEFGSMVPDQLELAFSYSNRKDQGSISFSISTFKKPDGSFQVFGNEEFRQLK